jgi:hypothetical protein
MAKAGVEDWQAVQYLVIPDELMLGNLGACLVMAGMRRSQTLIDREGLWFQGNDGVTAYVSVRVDRQGAGEASGEGDGSKEGYFLRSSGLGRPK